MIDLMVRLFHALFPLTQEKLNGFIEFAGPVKFQVLLCVILFCETGLVVTPFLPGDSLLFAVGAIGAGTGAAFHLPVLAVCLLCAVLLGDNANYWIGRRLGPAVFHGEESKFFNRKYLVKAHTFYETYGAKTIILARFVPIVRTFAPFVAGVGAMSYAKFFAFSFVGAILWVGACIGAGAMLGNVDFVKKHFEIVALVIVFISVLPMAFEAWKHRAAKRASV